MSKLLKRAREAISNACAFAHLVREHSTEPELLQSAEFVESECLDVLRQIDDSEDKSVGNN